MIRSILNQLEEGIIAFLLVFMTLLVFLDVVMRFGFGSGYLWTQELTLNTSAWFVLFGISYGLKVGAHIGVDAVVKLIPEKTRKYVSAVAVLICLSYCGIFLYGSFIYLQKIYMIGVSMEDIRFPMWFVNLLPASLIESWQIDMEDPIVLQWMVHGMLIFGMLLFSFRLFELFYRVITGKSTGFHQINEAEESLRLAKKLSPSLQSEEVEK